MSTDPQEFEKSPQPPKKWDYETFKEFLLSQSRGRDFWLSQDQFPEEIEISQDWQQVLNALRAGANKDDIERLALVGFNQKVRGIYLPKESVALRTAEKFETEGHRAVNPELRDLQKAAAFSEGIEGFVGLLHSHPPKKLWKVVLPLRGGLSAGDLHIAIMNTYGPMIGVADGSVNSFAFKTRDSIVPREGHKEFIQLWEKYPRLNLDIVIAQKYKLALYRAGINQSLKRVA